MSSEENLNHNGASPLPLAEEELMDTRGSPTPAEIGDSPCSPQLSPVTGLEQELQVAVDPVTMETEEVVYKGEDPFKSEGTVQFLIKDTTKLFSKSGLNSLSDPVYIRDLPWRLLVQCREVGTKEKDSQKALGVFVQCNPQGPDVPGGWSCWARASIKLMSREEDSKTINKEITHLFNSKENDWGFSTLTTYEDLVDPTKGFLDENDSFILEAHVIADAPHGINWDSKKHTGYVGLKNQGATCYMNSLLQTLYFTTKLRRAVYQMPTEHDDPIRSVPLALQRIFYELQHSDKSVGTKKLTKSFGWDTVDIFMQHDVQELSRVLLDNIESKMKGTLVEGTIPELFEGRTESYIRCTEVDYRSSREETFFDIQLNIKGKRNVYESFQDYVAEETLDGDNKYDAAEYGLQTAKKGVIFTKLPPVLHLHLMRFLYDPATDFNVKINDSFQFPEELDLKDFVKDPTSVNTCYRLHAVLVHSGDNYGGHYVVYVNPKGDGKWFKFDDDVVSRCSKKDAIDYNFGGNEETGIIRSCTSAYMLVYIRDNMLGDILQDCPSDDIPEHLKERILEERRLEALRRKERSEALLYLTVEVYREDEFQHHSGPDLISQDCQPLIFKVLKSTPLEEFHLALALSMGYPPELLRVWPFEMRTNSTFRPGYVCYKKNATKTVFELAEKNSVWKIFLELLPLDGPLKALPDYNPQSDVLLFYKYYNPKAKLIVYAGHSFECADRKFSELFPMLCESVGLPLNTPLILYEEVKPTYIELINHNLYLRQLEELGDGDIICFQRDVSTLNFELPTVEDYFRDLVNRVEVTFYNRSDSSDPGFTLILNQKMTYTQVAVAVADYIKEDMKFIQFFKPSHLRNAPEIAIRWNSDGYLRDFVLLRHRLELPTILYYQVLTIPVEQFESKKCFRCYFLNSKLKEEVSLHTCVLKCVIK